MSTFKLVNPRILGDYESNVSASNQRDAADKTWTNLTKYITKNVPNFLFTLEDNNGKLYNFRVSEYVEGKIANYDIEELSNTLDANQIRMFRQELDNLENASYELEGGHKCSSGHCMHRNHRKSGRNKNNDNDEDESCSSSSSSSSCSEDLYKKIKLIKSINSPQPIVYWWYAPYLYSSYKQPSVYIPTFNPPLLPYVELSLSSAWLG